ncbi:hypothetical protein PENTCL1PPCAC_24704, partial [Pristionchus entomophagus]
MRLLIKRSKEAYLDADWVSHIKLISQVTDASVGGNTDNVRYVEHIEVFKKPAALDVLSTELFGSTLGEFLLEHGKEYLLTDSLISEHL